MLLILSLLIDAGCCVGVTASCDEDVRDASTTKLKVLINKPKDNDWYVVLRAALYPSAIFDELWFLTTGPLVGKPVIFAEFSEGENCRCIFEKHNCDE